MNFTTKTISQGALILTLSAGGVFYTTSDSMMATDSGCILYTMVDGTSKKLCGQSAAIILNQANAEALKNEPQRFDSEPTSTASLPKKSKSHCLRKKDAGQSLGAFCKLSLALETKP